MDCRDRGIDSGGSLIVAGSGNVRREHGRVPRNHSTHAVANQALTSDQPIENQIAEETMVRPASSSDSSASSAPASIADSAPFAAAPAFNAAEQVSQEAHQPEAPQQEFTVPLPTEAELAAAVSAQMSEPNAIEPCLSQPYAAPAQEDQVEAPKAMAAAAAAETAPPDPSTIASIVESVLADLRPELSKKSPENCQASSGRFSSRRQSSAFSSPQFFDSSNFCLFAMQSRTIPRMSFPHASRHSDAKPAIFSRFLGVTFLGTA